MTPCFVEHFSKLPDPRIERNKLHELIDIIVLMICAVISGAEGWKDIADFGRNQLAWMAKQRVARGIEKTIKTRCTWSAPRVLQTDWF